jgi:hypothetical protein
MSYPFPYALGICLATLATLAASTWLAVIAFEAVLYRLAAPRRARMAAFTAALARRRAARARLVRCGETVIIAEAAAATAAAAVRQARYPITKGAAYARAAEVLREAQAAFETAKREAAEADEAYTAAAQSA